MRITRRFNVLSIFRDMWENKKVSAIVLLVCLVIGGLYGYYDYRKTQQEISDYENMIDYTQPITGEEDEKTFTLRGYYEGLDAYNEALEAARELRDTEKAYIDSSIYMKIDSYNVQVRSCSYVISETGNVGYILEALKGYIQYGELKEEVKAEGNDVDTTGWNEIISVNSQGANLNIIVVHYDMQSADEIMKIVQKKVEARCDTLVETQGYFVMTRIDDASYCNVDSSISNAQESHNNSLKIYDNYIVEQEERVIDWKKRIDLYLEVSDIAEPELNKKVSFAKSLVVFCIVGIFTGFLGLFAYFSLLVLIGDKINCARHLQYVNLFLRNVYNVKKDEYSVSLVKSVSEMELELRIKRANGICFYCFNDSDVLKVANDYLEKMNVPNKCLCINYSEISCAEIMCTCGRSVAIIRANRNRYSEIEDYLVECERFGVENLGFIVVE